MTEKNTQQTPEEKAAEIYFEAARAKISELFGGRDIKDIAAEQGLSLDQTRFVESVFGGTGRYNEAAFIADTLNETGGDFSVYEKGLVFKAAWFSLTEKNTAAQKSFAKSVDTFTKSDDFIKYLSLFDLDKFSDSKDLFTDLAASLTKYADQIQIDNLLAFSDIIFPVVPGIIEERRAKKGRVYPEEMFSNIDLEQKVFCKSIYDIAIELCSIATPILDRLDVDRQPNKINIEKIKALVLPIDPLTNSMLYDPKAANSGDTVYIDVTRRADQGGKDYTPQAVITYKLELADVESLANAGIFFSQEIEPEDLMNAFAVAELLERGEKELTFNQIHEAKGHRSTPSTKQRKQMRESFLRMSLTRMCYSNEKEIQAGYNYPKTKFTHTALFEYEEDFETTVNGNPNTATIKPLRVPPIVQIARERGQIMTVPVALLQTEGVKSTATNTRIRLYLLKRIRQAKNTKPTANKKNAGTTDETRAFKILYKKIFEKAGIDGKGNKERKQQSDARKIIVKMLEQFKYEREIVHYSLGKDGVTIYHTLRGYDNQ